MSTFRLGTAVVLLAVALAAGTRPVLGQCELAKITATDGAAGDRLGWSVGVNGNHAVVGAYKDDDYGTDSGAAFAYERNGLAWEQVVKLSDLNTGTPSQLTLGDQFGRAVAIKGDLAVDPGAGWQWEAVLRAADFESGDFFGDSVATDGVRVVIGAIGKSRSRGAAYVFKYDAGAPEKWVQESKFLASGAQVYDEFGGAVDIDGDWVVVGATHGNMNTGEAYVFQREPGTGWQEVQKLTALNDAGQDDSAGQDNFGNSVSLSGDRLVVGARYNDDACPEINYCNSGSAYVFRWEDPMWVIEKKLTAADAEMSDSFGISVSLNDELLFIGAYNGNDPGDVETGSAYLYRRDRASWIEVTEFNGSESETGDRFGISVGLGGDYAIVGAYSDDDNGSTAGAAYLFAAGPGEDCNGNGISDECDRGNLPGPEQQRYSG